MTMPPQVAADDGELSEIELDQHAESKDFNAQRRVSILRGRGV